VEDGVSRLALSNDKFPWAIPLFFMGRKVGWALYSGDVVSYEEYVFGALYEEKKKFGVLATGLWASLTIYRQCVAVRGWGLLTPVGDHILQKFLTLLICPDSEPTKLLDHSKQKPRRGGSLRRINTC
jgi:hypothetical protein